MLLAKKKKWLFFGEWATNAKTCLEISRRTENPEAVIRFAMLTDQRPLLALMLISSENRYQRIDIVREQNRKVPEREALGPVAPNTA